MPRRLGNDAERSIAREADLGDVSNGRVRGVGRGGAVPGAVEDFAAHVARRTAAKPELAERQRRLLDERRDFERSTGATSDDRPGQAGRRHDCAETRRGEPSAARP
jgi:hypothetical protein